MRKISFLLLVLFLVLEARENPFIPVDSAKTIGKTTAIKDTRVSFSKQSIKLPSSARILKSMELHYQNLDGSIESKVVKIDKNVDWHDELVLQKAYPIPPIKVEKPLKAIQKKEVKSQVQDIKESFNFLNTLQIDLVQKNIWLKTNDKKIRDFLVTKPYKIVLDFKKKISFTTKVFKTVTKSFKSITIGNHDNYYRVVIELDGHYRYSIAKNKQGFYIRLK